MPSARKHTVKLDAAIGRRLRKVRIDAGLTQTDLANSVGLTFQQIQKYETGSNRISASLLVVLAGKLKVPVGQLYGDAVKTAAPSGAGRNGSGDEFEREILEMSKSYRTITDPRVRLTIRKFVRELADKTR